MKPLETVWRPLVERRLLPVAILLIAALVAIPFLLASEPEPVVPVTPAPVAGAESLTATSPGADSIVSLVADGEPAKRRRVLGARKNPFSPGPAQKVKQPPAPASASQQQAPAPAGDSPSGSGGSASGPSTPPSSTPPSTTPPAVGGPPAAPRPKYELYSLTVRFGSSESESLDKLNLARLKALPSNKDPVLVYLGVAEDEKTAVFLVDAGVEPQGDGTCRPNPANCETIHLREGDTEFFDVKDEAGNVTEQFQLDLVDIKRRTTASAAKAKAARARASEAGRDVLQARKATSGPLRYRYDAKSGTVSKLDAKAFKALVARTAKVTASFFGGL